MCLVGSRLNLNFEIIYDDFIHSYSSQDQIVEGVMGSNRFFMKNEFLLISNVKERITPYTLHLVVGVTRHMSAGPMIYFVLRSLKVRDGVLLK
jgi:hypothetical protein